jgi:hypothetical protein
MIAGADSAAGPRRAHPDATAAPICCIMASRRPARPRRGRPLAGGSRRRGAPPVRTAIRLLGALPGQREGSLGPRRAARPPSPARHWLANGAPLVRGRPAGSVAGSVAGEETGWAASTTNRTSASRSVAPVLATLGRRAGVAGVPSRCFCHDAARRLVEAVDLPTVAALLGHSRLDTVRIYSQPDEAALERAAAALVAR